MSTVLYRNDGYGSVDVNKRGAVGWMRSAFGTVKSFGEEGLEVAKGRKGSASPRGRFSVSVPGQKFGSEEGGSCEEDEVHRWGG